ncbi:MAG: ArsR family transcriptional regulator [Bacteroidales bacterium]|jgi:DNA-binding HxlR family transcriptional regulator
MHEQTGNKIVEKLTIERSREILNDKMKMDILGLLEKEGPSSFGDIIREFEISQPTGTNHILELELLGLIEKKIDPPNYNINNDRYSVLLKYKTD